MNKILVQKQEQGSLPIWLLGPVDLEKLPPNFPELYSRWLNAVNFKASMGETSIISDPEGKISAVLFGLGAIQTHEGADARRTMSVGKLARSLPAGNYHFENCVEGSEDLVALAWMMGSYKFDRYLSVDEQAKPEKPSLGVTSNCNKASVLRIAESICQTRDLVNTPTNDLGPAHLEQAFRLLGEKFKANVSVIKGDDLLSKNFPMIHAVGRASVDAPRLLDMSWGNPGDTKVTLVGKGVCFDTGGLNIKPGSSMAAMKKDMGGAANVMGLAQMIMGAKLPVRLRVLVPAVENSISGNAFRPGDILPSRKGISVEIGNTDAEGRLVLGDALALADEQSPDILVDMATLTGAARVALGPDLPPFYTADTAFAGDVADAGMRLNDPVWRMPLWAPYSQMLSSKIADVNHISTGGFAGSITAALFLEKFVEKAAIWAHFDIYAAVTADKPWARAGGEAQAIRALFDVFSKRFPN
jgi:leucyl aminopeptidase